MVLIKRLLGTLVFQQIRNKLKGKRDCILSVSEYNCLHKLINAYSNKRIAKQKVICTKHKNTSVFQRKKQKFCFCFFSDRIVSFILIVLFNLAEFI